MTIRDGCLIGQILFSSIVIETDGGEAQALALARMAVLPDHQRQGIGSELVREGLEACCRQGHRIVVVLGNAQYYPRFGFTPASQHGVRCPCSVPDESFMVMALVPGSLDDIDGVVHYPAAFDLV